MMLTPRYDERQAKRTAREGVMNTNTRIDHDDGAELPETVVAGQYVPCWQCRKMVLYHPPYLPDEYLCDECSDFIGAMIKNGEFF